MFFVNDDDFAQSKANADKFVRSGALEDNPDLKRAVATLNEFPFLATVSAHECMPLNDGTRPVMVGHGSITQISFVLKNEYHAVQLLDHLNRQSTRYYLAVFYVDKPFKKGWKGKYTVWSLRQTVYFEAEKEPQMKKLLKLIQKTRKAFLSL
jgi:hypothetical protein